jgi:hypothetical protein
LFTATFVGWQSQVATIPTGLFDKVNTANAVILGPLYNQTFRNWKSTVANIPAGLFKSLDFSSAQDIENSMGHTFNGWLGTGNFNEIVEGINLADKVDISNVAHVFGQMFLNANRITGKAMPFVNLFGDDFNFLDGVAFTFRGCTGLEDYSDIPIGWR